MEQHDSEAPPRTGAELLREALDDPDYLRRTMRVPEVLAAVEANIVNKVAYHTIPSLLAPRPGLTSWELDKLYQEAWGIASETIRAFTRALVSAKCTLRALANGRQSPIHGLEREGLLASVRRTLSSCGFDLNETNERPFLYALADDFTAGLARPVKVRPARLTPGLPVGIPPLTEQDLALLPYLIDEQIAQEEADYAATLITDPEADAHDAVQVALASSQVPATT